MLKQKSPHKKPIKQTKPRHCYLKKASTHLQSRANMSTTTTTTSTKKPSVDPLPFLSEISKRREQSPTRALMPLLKIPGMVSLGSGLPNAACFPLESLSFTLKGGTQLSLSAVELNESLQYGATPGSPALLASLRKQLLRDHTLQYDETEFSISVTSGSQNGLTLAFEMLINPGDNIIVEKPTYSGAIGYLRPLGAQFNSVSVDSHGMIPNELESVLQSFDATPEKRPKVIYTIATGQNPSGATAPVERKRQIYKIAQKYNCIILEDDPYFNLYYGSKRAPESIDSFVATKPDSYLSMDVDGRVLRFDSFSKILSSGLRLGVVSGPKAFVEQLNLTTQVTTLHTCGLAQVIANKILTEWGVEGWDNHVKKAKFFYAQRRDLFIDKLKEKLGDMVEYTTPDAGMFVFMSINPKYVGNDTNSIELIQKKAVDAKVLLLPGEAFLTEKPDKMYVRASFSVATPEEMDIALDRFRGLIENEKNARGL